jgi:hypothetical protein
MGTTVTLRGLEIPKLSADPRADSWPNLNRASALAGSTDKDLQAGEVKLCHPQASTLQACRAALIVQAAGRRPVSNDPSASSSLGTSTGAHRFAPLSSWGPTFS